MEGKKEGKKLAFWWSILIFSKTVLTSCLPSILLNFYTEGLSLTRLEDESSMNHSAWGETWWFAFPPHHTPSTNSLDHAERPRHSPLSRATLAGQGTQGARLLLSLHGVCHTPCTAWPTAAAGTRSRWQQQQHTHREEEAEAMRKQKLWASWGQEEERTWWRNWLVGTRAAEEVESGWETSTASAQRDKIPHDAVMSPDLPSTPLITSQAPGCSLWSGLA